MANSVSECRINQRLTDDEVLAAATACVDDVGFLPRLYEYLVWANRSDVIALPGRRPRSAGPFARFGGFRGALRRARLLEDERAEQLSDGAEVVRHFAYSKEESSPRSG